jgi:hypothetical protein
MRCLERFDGWMDGWWVVIIMMDDDNDANDDGGGAVAADDDDDDIFNLKFPHAVISTIHFIACC